MESRRRCAPPARPAGSELLETAQARLRALAAEGVTTVEVKSGYGLDVDTELRMLRVARELGESGDIDVLATFLGAHALPPGYGHRREEYLRLLIEEMLPAVAEEGLADAVDAYCEGVAFSTAEVKALFERARALGLPLRLHAEQFSNSGGAAMAAELGALSCDHLEYLDEAGNSRPWPPPAPSQCWRRAPGITFRETRKPPVEALRAAGVPMAVSTDHNPGTSPMLSLLAAMNMACVLFRLSPEEALRGATVNAARALGLSDRGVIEPGKLADLAVWDVQDTRRAQLRFGPQPLPAGIQGGGSARSKIRVKDTVMSDSRTIRAPRGAALSCKSWLTEAPMRMLMNNLDPDVAENPAELVVYGGRGKAARNWQAYDRIIAALKALEDDETLLVQSGKPVAVLRTTADAPRVLIANSNLVPHWATLEHFNELDRKGLMMFGQMTAGSWIYIGSQGIVQGTYETYAEMGRQHFGGEMRGKWFLTAGLGGMGGAQPLACTMAGACMLAVDCRQTAIDFRLRTRYLDQQADDLDRAVAMINAGLRAGRSALGRVTRAMPPRFFRNWPDARRPIRAMQARRRIRPDLRPRSPERLPAAGLDDGQEHEERSRSDPAGTVRAAKQSMAVQVRAMLEFWERRIPVVDYGNNIRQMALETGVENAFDFPGFVPAYVRPLFCRGKGPFRWAALSGDPGDIARTDAKVKELLPDDDGACAAGWTWRRSGSSFRACPLASAGWAWATVTASAWRSTRWSATANSRRRS